MLELYPNFKDTEKPSCTEIELQDDQSMPINSTVAQVAYNMFYNIISGKTLNYNMVKCNINNVFTTNTINIEYLIETYCKLIHGNFNEEIFNAFIEFRDIFELINMKNNDRTYFKLLENYVQKFKIYSLPFIDYLRSNSLIYHSDHKDLINLIIKNNEDINANI